MIKQLRVLTACVLAAAACCGAERAVAEAHSETRPQSKVEAASSHPHAGPVATTTPCIRIDAKFPGGNIIVDRIDGDQVYLRPDLRDTQKWWFYWYLRVRGVESRTVTFTFTDGNPIGVRGPALSTDGGDTWSWLGAESVKKSSFNYTFPAQPREVRFAYTIPYVEKNLQAFLRPLRNIRI